MVNTKREKGRGGQTLECRPSLVEEPAVFNNVRVSVDALFWALFLKFLGGETKGGQLGLGGAWALLLSLSSGTTMGSIWFGENPGFFICIRASAPER
jgi:hypothetical protein